LISGYLGADLLELEGGDIGIDKPLLVPLGHGGKIIPAAGLHRAETDLAVFPHKESTGSLIGQGKTQYVV
jgi:hypothetical protein